MATSSGRPKSSHLKVNKGCAPDKEINILLLGQTGVGKSTFINAFANYLVYNTLDEAIKGDMQVIIPSSFSFPDPETFEEKLIQIGEKDNQEKIAENGQSCTQQCQSFVFPMGERNLRLIDTPGTGDTRGNEQDSKNLFEILTYVSHYEHLNGICIFLKPNEERLTISFRLCIKQILHYLHKSARENMIFIFTSARSTFFRPGSSKKLLQVLLNEQRDQDNLEVPFSKENTFLLDNEPFHYLALRKNGITVNDDQKESYRKSWDHTVGEYQRLMAYICKCPLHAIANTLSLNEAEQLIRKLSRPIAQTIRLIQQNIQIAKECKKELSKNQGNTSIELSEYTPRIIPFQHPRLVCVGKNCLHVIEVNHEKKIPYRICQEESYINGVIQEAISDSRIGQLDLIDKQTDKCTECGCSWKCHINITYEYDINLKRSNKNNNNNEKVNIQLSVSAIEEHIKNLKNEQEHLEDVYNKLSRFLHINAIHPCDDDILDYLRLFIREEQMKHEVGIRNTKVIDGLTQIMTRYEHDMDGFKKELANKKDSNNGTDKLKPDEVFSLVGTLYRLPINGEQIRSQTTILKISEDAAVRRMERNIKLPLKAASSQITYTLTDTVLTTTV